MLPYEDMILPPITCHELHHETITPPPTCQTIYFSNQGVILGPTSAHHPSTNSLHFFLFMPSFPSSNLHASPPASSHTTMSENKRQKEIHPFGVQAMRPKLVKSKLLQVPLGSNSFIADIQATKLAIDVATAEKPILQRRHSEDIKITQTFKLFASTWNVGGIPPSDDLNFEDWLDTSNGFHDIYVLGFQEIVPLSTKNVLGLEKSRVSMKWSSIIRATLNKSLLNSSEGQENVVWEKQKVYPVKNDGSMEKNSQEFRCIMSKQMVGILVYVWVRSNLVGRIRHLDVSSVGCGIMGCLGNKGSVSVRFFLQETSFCFVCCHLASGGKEGDEVHRNSDAMEIFSRTSFPQGPFLPQKIIDHDRIIFLGDLNYRISLPHSRTRSLVEQKEWDILLENDQLKGEVSDGRAFQGWKEGEISFLPTYKYYPNSDEYYGCLRKGEKRRAPAWCDRILWHGEGLTQTNYDRFELKLSDHRPVRAFFTVEVEVSRNLNSLRNCFLSERFDHMKDNVNV